MTVFISVVSHEDTREIIHDLQPHRLASPGFKVIILDNRPCNELERYAEQHDLHYLKNSSIQGFGTNHNKVFHHCLSALDMELKNDWFIVLNPDLECDLQAINSLIDTMQSAGARIGAPNIFKERSFQVHEESVRRFPYLWELLTSYLFRKNRTGVDRHCPRACPIDWASGACLAFSADTFNALGGFDQRYFLYYEDVDICWRARHLLGEKAYYIPDAKMVHKGKRASHTLNNRHLWWHLTSAIRFSWVRTKTALFGANSLR